jgi:SPP1 gp7 family putative phage head morphogenesis protein
MVFQEYCNAAAYKMVTMIERQNMRTWREAASGGSRGREIYEALKRGISSGFMRSALSQQIIGNAALIKKMPYELAIILSDYIQTETFKGHRASDISKDLQQQYKSISKSRIDLIARTETSKTQCALTEARAKNLGIEWYVWRTSKDVRVRHSHDEMDGVLVKWNNPPNPEKMFGGHNSGNSYHAGMIYNCRCYAEPVVDINRVNFPHKVHTDGTVKSVSKSSFESIM